MKANMLAAYANSAPMKALKFIKKVSLSVFLQMSFPPCDLSLHFFIFFVVPFFDMNQSLEKTCFHLLHAYVYISVG